MNTTSKTTIWRKAIVPAVLLVTGSALPADTILYEGFDIPPGEIDFTSGETSWGWKRDNSNQQLSWWAWDQPNNDFYHGVSEEGLVWEGLATVGNAFEFRDEAVQGSNIAHRLLPKFYQYNSSGQLWMSALFNPQIDGNPDGGGYFQLCLSDFHNAVYMGVSNALDYSVWSAGGERLKLNGVAGEKWGMSEVPIESGETAFLVMHLDFDNKTAAFYANPPVDAEDPGMPAAEFTMWEDMWIDKIMLWVYNAGPTQEGEGADYTGSRVDEIRLGDTYASVAGGADLTDPGGGSTDTTPPVITGPSGSPGDASASASIEENTVKVTDMIANEEVNWEISGGADGDLFTIGKGTGGLSFKDLTDFETPIDADANNVYVVQVKATDISGNESTQVLLVTVTDVNEQGDITPPVITGPSGSAGNNNDAVSIDENTVAITTMTADEEVTWAITESVDQSFFTIGETSGVLEFVEAPDFENPGDFDHNNAYVIDVQATDLAGNSSMQTLTITVLDVAEQATDWAGFPIVNTDGDVNTGNFLGWINVKNAPLVLSYTLNTYIFMEEVYVTDSGAWGYVYNQSADAPMGGDTTWAGYTVLSSQDVDTKRFLGWINIRPAPYVFSYSFSYWVYMPESFVTTSGSWGYMFNRN